ncbi:MAG TPA: hypothetical protein VNA25_06365 [Phycisphaerae bacterium]|nr:hypothetical protein [Phycisphaerae bacterium]
MSITFRCEHCKKEVTAPDAAAGKRGKCPFCGASRYIPAPVSEEDLLDLAPIDEQAERTRQEEIDSLRRQERSLLRESEQDAPLPLEHREDLSAADLHHFVVNYCLDLYGSKLDRLWTHVSQLRRFKPLAVQAVDEFLSGKASEPALDPIPTPTLKAFLTRLSEEIQAG